MIKRYRQESLIYMLIFICVFLLLLGLVSPTPSLAVIRTVEGTVTQVTDGDTLKIETAEWKKRGRVHYLMGMSGRLRLWRGKGKL